MMEVICLLTTLSVVLCMSVGPVRGGPHADCGNKEGWNYSEELLATTNAAIWGITVSHHTGNVYVANFWTNTLLAMKEGNVAENIRIMYIMCVAADYTVPQVYAGSSEGLYIYNEMSGSVTKVRQVQHKVYKIFVSKNSRELYVATFFAGVYRYRNWFTEETIINSDVKYEFVVDHGDNYFYNSKINDRDVTGLQLNGHNDTTTFTHGLFDRLGVDNDGRVFGVFGILHDIARTVHHLNTDGTSQEVATLDFAAFHMSFDKDNNAVFGTTDNKIIKLKFNKCIFPSTTESSNTTVASQRTT